MAAYQPQKRTHYDVMLSSTGKDLEEHRKVVTDAISRNGLFPQSMDLDSALPEDVIDASLNKVTVSDAYVGLIGYRYGQVPESVSRNPGRVSITELEYNKAEELGLPICMFVMSDQHPVPRSAVRQGQADLEKLEAFRQRASKQHIHAEFDSVEDLKLKVMQSLGEIRRRLDEAQSAHVATSARAPAPAPISRPKLLAMPPYAPGHTFEGRSRELQIASDWAVTSGEPILILEAIGGMGKSMLCWHWVNHHAYTTRADFAGIFWYSFYERGADMSDFCAQALAYVSGRPIDEFRGRKTAALAFELIPLLRERPWLLAMDGLERVLVAYHRPDAAQVRDEEVDASDESGKQRAHDCIRPADSDLLRTLTEASPSKFLISTRLMPSALLNNSGLERPGVAHVKLTGLDPSDAEAMLRRVGIRGDSAGMRRYLERNFGCHPLVVGVVGGLIRNYSPAPGDFDSWVEDPSAGDSINLATMDLVQRRNHILKTALNVLEPDSRTLLARMALVSESVDYETLVQLNPVMQQGLPKSEVWLRETLQDLDFRGLIQLDRNNRKYDMHPVVRGYTLSSIGPDQLEGIAQKVVDHFSSRPDPPYEGAKSINDLHNGLQVARTLLHLGRVKEVIGISTDLTDALFWNLEAYDEYISLIRPLFANGWDHPSNGIEGQDLSAAWNGIGIALAATGKVQDAIGIAERTLDLALDLNDDTSLPTFLRTLCVYQQGANHLYATQHLLEILSEVTGLLGDKEDLALTYLWRLSTCVTLGDLDSAEQWWTQFDELPRPTSRQVYRPGYGEYCLAKLRARQGRIDEDLLAGVERLAEAGNNRSTIGDLHELRGEWNLSRGQWAAAAEAFEERIKLSREANLPSFNVEARLGIAQVHLGHAGVARENAERLSAIEEPPDSELAELYIALGDREMARKHVYPGYKTAWADGAPYVNCLSLQRCRNVLQALGDPEPRLSPFDPSTAKPFPFEAKLAAYVDKKRNEKHEKQAASH